MKQGSVPEFSEKEHLGFSFPVPTDDPFTRIETEWLSEQLLKELKFDEWHTCTVTPEGRIHFTDTGKGQGFARMHRRVTEKNIFQVIERLVQRLLLERDVVLPAYVDFPEISGEDIQKMIAQRKLQRPNWLARLLNPQAENLYDDKVFRETHSFRKERERAHGQQQLQVLIDAILPYSQDLRTAITHTARTQINEMQSESEVRSISSLLITKDYLELFGAFLNINGYQCRITQRTRSGVLEIEVTLDQHSVLQIIVPPDTILDLAHQLKGIRCSNTIKGDVKIAVTDLQASIQTTGENIRKMTSVYPRTSENE